MDRRVKRHRTTPTGNIGKLISFKSTCKINFMYYELSKQAKKLPGPALIKDLMQNFGKGLKNSKPSSPTGETEKLQTIKMLTINRIRLCL